MYWLYPLVYAGNVLATNQLLQSNSRVYRQSPLAVRHEILARWNNSLTQLSLSTAIFFFNTSDSFETFTFAFSVYFMTDMIHMLLYCSDWMYYVHHIIPILVHFTLQDSMSAEEKTTMMFIAGLLELTTPPISLAWTLSKLQLKGWYSPYLAAFAYLNFFGIRIVYFPYLWYTQLPFLLQCTTLPFHFMNIFWFSKMTSYIKGQFYPHDGKKLKQHSYA